MTHLLRYLHATDTPEGPSQYFFEEWGSENGHLSHARLLFKLFIEMFISRLARARTKWNEYMKKRRNGRILTCDALSSYLRTTLTEDGK